MAKESLLVNEELEQHTVVPIVGDGACLFRALSFLIHGTQDNAMEVRSLIVGHVMTSFGGKQVTADGFSPTFKVKGQVYHLIGSILPEPGQGAQYLQVYFVGEDEREVNIRCSKYPNLKPNLIKQLQDMLHQVNPYIKDLKSAIDKIPSR